MTDEVQENGTEQPVKASLDVTPSDVKPSENKGDNEAKSEKNQDKSQPDSKESPAKDKGPGPWQQKLAEKGLTDPAFDEFLRTEVQPYITRLEQGGADGGSGLWGGDAELEQAGYELVQAFQTDPVGTLQQLSEMIGITPGMEDAGYEEPVGEDSDAQYDDEDPRMQYIQDLMEREQAEREDAEYAEFLDEMGKRVPNFDADLYTTILAGAADGDLDIAWETYSKFHDRLRVEEKSEAPPQLGGSESGTAPPSAPQYDSIGDAVTAFMNEDRARRQRA